MTGIEGTGGTTLAAFGAAMICLGGLLKTAFARPGGVSGLLTLLLLLAIFGVATAALFLLPYHPFLQLVTYGLLIVALVGLIGGAARLAKLCDGEAA